MLIISNHNGDEVITDKSVIMAKVAELFTRGYTVYQNFGTRENLDLQVIDRNSISENDNLFAMRGSAGG